MGRRKLLSAPSPRLRIAGPARPAETSRSKEEGEERKK
jgi:hypothetical protein